MRQLWRDITRHPRLAWTFLFCWAALWVWTQLTRRHGPTGDISPVPGVLQLLVPILAGAFVGWRRKYDAKQLSGEQGSALARALGGGTLAGMLLMLADVVILFSVEAIYDLHLEWGAGAEVLEWLIGLGILGSLLGFIGAIVGSGLERAFRPR
jgi:hypothetical protein